MLDIANISFGVCASLRFIVWSYFSSSCNQSHDLDNLLYFLDKVASHLGHRLDMAKLSESSWTPYQHEDLLIPYYHLSAQSKDLPFIMNTALTYSLYILDL